MNNKILTIALWEFLEKIKRRSFIFSMILTPVIFVGISSFTSLFSSGNRESVIPVGVLDETQNYSNDLFRDLRRFKLDDGQPKYIALNFFNPNISSDQRIQKASKAVAENEIFCLIYITDNDTKSLAELRVNFFCPPSCRDDIMISIRRIHGRQLFEQNNIPLEILNEIETGIDIREIFIGETAHSESDLFNHFISSFLMILLLIIMILLSGGMFVRSLLEEKSNRIIEIILSSCSHNDLLTGKFFGLASLGLFQAFIWFILGAFIFQGDLFNAAIFNNFGWQMLFFISGYFLYTSLFAGIGAIVTTEHEAQMLTGNISLILIIPIAASVQVIESPASALAQFLSYFPLTSPAVMILRLNIYEPSLFEILITLGIILITTYAVVLFSAKIFKVGILSAGKRPGIKEIFNWMKEK